MTDTAEVDGAASTKQSRAIAFRSGKSEWSAGWPVVVTSMLGNALAGIHLFTMGAMVAPIESQTGWSRTEIMSGIFAYSVSSIICLPVAGYLLDRFGPRAVALPGIALYCVAVALLGLIGQSLWQWLAIWLLIGIGGSLIKPILWVSTVSRFFDRRRGIAVAVVLCGSGIAGVTLPTIADALSDTYGWRGAYLIVALAAVVIVLPLAGVTFRGLYGRASGRGRGRQAELSGLSTYQAFRSSQYARIAAAAIMMSVAMLGLVINFIPIVVDKDVERGVALVVVGLIGIFSIVGRLVTGFFLDRVRGPLVAAISFLLPLIPVALLLVLDGGTVCVTAIAILLGLSLGAEHDTLSYLATRYFGLRNFGVIFSVIVALLVFGEGIGPVIASMAHDKFGSYDPFLIVSMVLFPSAAVALFTLGPYPDFRTPPPRSQPTQGAAGSDS